MQKKNVWTGLSSLFSFFLVFVILGTNCLFDYEGTVNGALGIETSKVVNRGDTEGTIYFESEYGSLNEENLQKLIQDTYAESVLEEEEGAVLLKNDNNALPLDSNMQVTLFGHAVAQPLYKAASAGSKGYKGEYCVSLYDALHSAGFEINDILYNAYVNSSTARGNGAYDFQNKVQNEWSLGEEKLSFYTDELKQSWENAYNDAAIVMLAREGGEGSETYMEDPEEGISQLALHQNEKDLLKMINDSGKFKKIIVLINSGNAMELGWLDEYHVDACLWIGQPGQRGFEGVANILTGLANPSGKLVDTYAENSLSAPSTVNGGYHNQQWTNLDQVLENTTEDEADVSFYSVQAEGIYLGYKYYETRYEDCILDQGNATDAAGASYNGQWNYADEIVYPFGYGLSYTQFEQSLDSVSVDEENIKVTVTVKNTGNVSGKSVVQIYAQTPYGDYEKKNSVEKSSIQLLDFGKTDMLAPGESQSLTIDCDKYLLTSYDYTKEKGYILSEGDYYIAIGNDAHDALNNVLAKKGESGLFDQDKKPVSGNVDKVYEWKETFDKDTYNNSLYTGIEVTNQFDEADLNYWIDGAVTYLSRSDWAATYPVKPVEAEATDEMIEVLNGEYYQKSENAASVSDYTQGENKNIPLATLIGVDYEDEKWDEYLNQFTIEEMAGLLPDIYNNKGIAKFGVPSMIVGDGPDGVGGLFNEEKYGDGRNDCAFPSEIVLASTFNKDLMRRRGELMGEEAMYLGMAHVWMIGVNLHRTPFGGRNFEYYSEDATMSYLCQIPEVEGVESKGVQAGVKHFTGNDQENNRMGVACLLNEQAFREGALRACEGALAKAGSNAVMHGFNRVGLKWCSSSSELCTDILIKEWGFQGMQETDAISTGPAYQRHFSTSLMAGTDFYCLDFKGASTNAIVEEIKANNDGDLLGRLRSATKNHLYIMANSSIMNGYSVDSTVVAVTPWWQPVTYSLIALFALLEAWCVVMLVIGKKGKKDDATKEGMK